MLVTMIMILLEFVVKVSPFYRHDQSITRRMTTMTVSYAKNNGENEQSSPLRYFNSIEDLTRWESETAVDTQRAKPLCSSQNNDNDDTLLLPQRRRVLHCHDYAGGYQPSADEDYLATFSSWNLFDLFVYFSHHRVVVPPYIWIKRSHEENKIILGTFLFEGGKDSPHAQEFLQSSENWKLCADQLVELCIFYGFDGWLINFETDLGADRVHDFVGFLSYLQTQMKERVGVHAQVIYYDAHNEQNGIFKPQDALLATKNKSFFDSCDGIFINYQWFDYGTVQRCKEEAGPHRQFDVYAGIDVWARNCEYDEGAACKEAVDSATQGGVSLAIFAPGWVQEKGPGSKKLAGSEAARSIDFEFWNDMLAVPHAEVTA